MSEQRFCKDCKYAREGGLQDLYFTVRTVPWRCSHPRALDPVSGAVREECSTARYRNGICGTHGGLFEAGEPVKFVPMKLSPIPIPDPAPAQEPKTRWWRLLK